MLFTSKPMILILTVAIVLYSAHFAFSQSSSQGHFKTLSGQVPLIIGHRGAPGFGGENTLAGFEKAVKELGADGFEIDIMPTKDGKLVVSHDYELSRLIGTEQLEALFPEKGRERQEKKEWWVTDFTQQELNQLKVTYPPAGIDERLDYKDLEHNYRMPTLTETLDLFVNLKKQTNNPDLKIYIEIKINPNYVNASQYPDIINTLSGVLKSYNLLDKPNNVWIQSFNADLMTQLGATSSLNQLHKTQLIGGNEPGFRNITSASQYRNFLEKHVKDKNLDILHMSKLPMRLLVEKHNIDVAGIAHELGLQLHLYTFRDPQFFTDYYSYQNLTDLRGFHSAQEELLFYYQQGVDAIMSDYIVSAREALQVLQKQ